jgi:hypothetical protein
MIGRLRGATPGQSQVLTDLRFVNVSQSHIVKAGGSQTVDIDRDVAVIAAVPQKNVDPAISGGLQIIIKGFSDL